MSVRDAKRSLFNDAPKATHKQTAKYVLREEDVRDFQALVDCIAALYAEESEEEGAQAKIDCGRFLKQKVEELGTRLKSISQVRKVQELNLRATQGIYHFAFFKTIGFVEKYVDRRIAMVLRMVHNSLANTFEGLADILSDLAKSEAVLRQNTQRLRSELDLTLDHQEQNNNLFHEASLTIPLDSERPSFMVNEIDLDRRLVEEPKRLTFQQLNELMDELHETKLSSDTKNLETRMPRRTMEAHLHEVFKNKFGLKNIVGENLLAFLHTLRHYSVYDTRARTFLAIVRNECEEEFLLAIRAVETTLVVLLKMFIYGGSPTAPEPKVNQEVNRRINGVVALAEIAEVVRYLYSEDDAAELLRRISNEQERPNPDKYIHTRADLLMDQDRTSLAVINYKCFRRVNLNS